MPVALVADTVTVGEPAAVGVPEIKPLALIVKPGGSVLEPKLAGLLLAVIW